MCLALALPGLGLGLALALPLLSFGFALALLDLLEKENPDGNIRAFTLTWNRTAAVYQIVEVKKRKIVAYGLTAMVILLILLVERLPQPWRGIVDAGVLLGLSWGLVSFWIFTVRAFFGLGPAVDPELS